MIRRAIEVWCAILLMASINGAAREAWLIPQLGEGTGRVISTVLLSGLVLAVTWVTIGWIGPRTRTDALKIGILWLGLTLAFEFLAGHYLFRTPWEALLADYDLTRGRIWMLVLVFVLLTPLWSAQARSLLRR